MSPCNCFFGFWHTHAKSICNNRVERFQKPYGIPREKCHKNHIGTITSAAVDDSVFRILRSMFDVGVMDEPDGTWDWSKLSRNVTTEASVESARRLAAASTVLLKNEGAILPLAKVSQKSHKARKPHKCNRKYAHIHFYILLFQINCRHSSTSCFSRLRTSSKDFFQKSF